MKKCPKCNEAKLKESPYNKFTGYESYRCKNPSCNSLFDISDLNDKDDYISSDDIKYSLDIVKKASGIVSIKKAVISDVNTLLKEFEELMDRYPDKY